MACRDHSIQILLFSVLREEVKWGSEASSTGSISKGKQAKLMHADDRQGKQNEKYVPFSRLAAPMASTSGVTAGRTRKVAQQGPLLVFC